MGCLKLTYGHEEKPTFLKVWKNPGTTSQKVGCLDYGARMYDPALGRWQVMDLQAEKMRPITLYGYSYNNPINFIDINGEIPWHALVSGFNPNNKPDPPTMSRQHPTLTGVARPHHGIDMRAKSGTSIHAAAEGTVIMAKKMGGGAGNTVVIDHGNGFYSIYMHMEDQGMLVGKGDKVKNGQAIGKVGMTGGISSGPHLHVEYVYSEDGDIWNKDKKNSTRFNPIDVGDLQKVIDNREESSVTFVDGSKKTLGGLSNTSKADHMKEYFEKELKNLLMGVSQMNPDEREKNVDKINELFDFYTNMIKKYE